MVGVRLPAGKPQVPLRPFSGFFLSHMIGQVLDLRMALRVISRTFQ